MSPSTQILLRKILIQKQGLILVLDLCSFLYYPPPSMMQDFNEYQINMKLFQGAEKFFQIADIRELPSSKITKYNKDQRNSQEESLFSKIYSEYIASQTSRRQILQNKINELEKRVALKQNQKSLANKISQKKEPEDQLGETWFYSPRKQKVQASMTYNFQQLDMSQLPQVEFEGHSRLGSFRVKSGVIIFAFEQLRKRRQSKVPACFIKGAKSHFLFKDKFLIHGGDNKLYCIQIDQDNSYDYKRVNVNFDVSTVMQSVNYLLVCGEVAKGQIFLLDLTEMTLIWVEASLDKINSFAVFQNRLYLVDWIGKVMVSKNLIDQAGISVSVDNSQLLDYEVFGLATIRKNSEEYLLLALSPVQYRVKKSNGAVSKGRFPGLVNKIWGGQSQVRLELEDGSFAISLLDKDRLSFIKKEIIEQ